MFVFKVWSVLRVRETLYKHVVVNIDKKKVLLKISIKGKLILYLPLFERFCTFAFATANLIQPICFKLSPSNIKWNSNPKDQIQLKRFFFKL